MEPAYCLSKSFREHVRHSVCSGTASHLNVVPVDVTAAAPAKEFVDNYNQIFGSGIVLPNKQLIVG